jgi:hypothetical protein
MANYKMNSNREKLSDEDLQEKMNFEKFMREYQPVSFYKTWKFYAMAALAGLMISGTFLLYSDGNEPSPKAEANGLVSFVSPPLSGVNVDYTAFLINASSDTILHYPSGSELHIPSNAFLDEHGLPVKGHVELRYREFHDAADYFVSGIPMTYDSAGMQYQFESAGMLDIRAFQDGKPLFVNTNEQINVAMASDVIGTRFNIYYLDTTAKKWSYMKEDVVLKEASLYDKSGESMPAIDASTERIPQAPEKASSNMSRFDIAFDKKLFPELAVYQDVSFQVSKDETTYDPKLAMSDWDNVKIARCADGIHYLVTFSNRTESHVFKVEPVFAGADYINARKVYAAKMKAYEHGLALHNEQLTAKRNKLDSTYRSQYALMNAANSRAGAGLKSESQREASENKIRHEFEISRFGIWNSDCPSSLPTGKMIFAKFSDVNKKKFDFNHVYLVEKGRKAMFTYYPEAYKMFTYNPKVENTLWAVTKENKLAVFRVDDFSKIKSDKDTSNFIMEVSEIRINSVVELKKLLGI